jgi:aspartate aminotransferase
MARFDGDDNKLALHLLEHGVAVVASSFGGKDGFRISFATGEDVLAEAIRRIETALA